MNDILHLLQKLIFRVKPKNSIKGKIKTYMNSETFRLKKLKNQ